jgi:translation initiation factor 2B subunit (eIF-2B alpha/beta/delta family)
MSPSEKIKRSYIALQEVFHSTKHTGINEYAKAVLHALSQYSESLREVVSKDVQKWKTGVEIEQLWYEIAKQVQELVDIKTVEVSLNDGIKAISEYLRRGIIKISFPIFQNKSDHPFGEGTKTPYEW